MVELVGLEYEWGGEYRFVGMGGPQEIARLKSQIEVSAAWACTLSNGIPAIFSWELLRGSHEKFSWVERSNILYFFGSPPICTPQDRD